MQVPSSVIVRVSPLASEAHARSSGWSSADAHGRSPEEDLIGSRLVGLLGGHPLTVEFNVVVVHEERFIEYGLATDSHLHGSNNTVRH